MENDKTFELMTKMYAEMTSKMDKMYSEMQGMNERLGNVEIDTNTLKSDLKKIGVKIDGVVTPKIEALFDGYKQNSEQLNRIEQEVSKHEEVILKRVK